MLQSIDKNFRLHASQIAEQTPGMKVSSSENLTYVDSGLSCDTFNIIHITDGTTITQPQLSDALHYFRERDRAYCLWVSRENLTPNLQQYLEELSLLKQNEEAGMALDLERYDPVHRDEHTNIVVADRQDKIMEYAQVVASNWEPPDLNVIEYYQRTGSHYLSKQNGVLLLLYYLEGKPVATVEMFPTDDSTIGLYGLATLRAYRGRGIGSALMSFALNQAKALGYRHVILQASEDGIRIYQKLGFEVYTTYYEYA